MGRRVGQERHGVEGLGSLRRLLNSLALRDVGDERHETRLPFLFGEAEADLDGKLVAVNPAAGQIEYLPHRPNTRNERVARTVPGVDAPHELGPQDREEPYSEL